jgi:hypothetical protein
MDVALQSAHNLLNFFDSRRTGSLGCSDILRFGSVGVFESIKSGIALNAAVRTDLDRAEEILLQEPAAMRSKYLGTAAIWTRPLGLGTHIRRFQVDSDSRRKDARELSGLAIQCLMYPDHL